MRVPSWLWVVLCIGACSGDDGPPGQRGPTLKGTIGLDVSSIQGFAIGESTSARQGVLPHAGVTVLYTIDAQGNLTETTLVELPGDGGIDTTMLTAMPTQIHDTPKHVLFEYSGLQVQINESLVGCGAVIMRKTDGVLYCYAYGGFNRADGDGADYLVVDGSFMHSPMGPLTRIDMSTASPEVSPLVEMGAVAFDVSTHGDTLVSLSNPTVNGTRIFKKSGGLQNVLAEGAQAQWLAANRIDFYYLSIPVTPSILDVNLATYSSSMYTLSAAGTIPKRDGDQVRVPLVTSSAAYAWMSNTTPRITDLVGSAQGAEHDLISLTGLATVSDVRGAAASLFVRGTDAVGNGGIARVDVPAFSSTMIVPPGELTLTAISASKTGDLSFAGQRNSDGKRIVGHVSAGASTYTITSTTAPPVVQLQRIN